MFNYHKRFLVIFLSVIISCLLIVPLWAEDEHVCESIRALGMGGVGLGIADNEDVLLYNSAGLSYLDKWKLSYNFLMLGFNNDVFKIYELMMDDEMQEVMDGDGYWADASDELKDEILSDRSGIIKLGTNLSFLCPGSLFNWGLGFYTATKTQIDMDMGIFVPKLGVHAEGDIVGVFSVGREFNLPFYQDILNPISAGMTIRYLQRYKIDDYRSVEEFVDVEFDDLLRRGYGMGVDFGGMYRMLDKRLIIAATATDFAGTKIKWDDGGSSVVNGSLNVGVSFAPKKIYYWKDAYFDVDNLILACDIIDIGKKKDFYQRIHLGLEYDLYTFLKLRGGFNEGYPSFGLKFVFLEYAFYGEEIGSYAGQWADWHHLMSISLKF